MPQIRELSEARLRAAVRQAIETAIETDDPDEFDYVNLRPIAERAGLKQRELLAAVRAGNLFPVLPVTQRIVLVRRRDLRDWEARAEVSAARAAAVRGHLDDRPAEPFAEMKATPTPRKMRGQGRMVGGRESSAQRASARGSRS